MSDEENDMVTLLIIYNISISKKMMIQKMISLRRIYKNNML